MRGVLMHLKADRQRVVSYWSEHIRSRSRRNTALDSRNHSHHTWIHAHQTDGFGAGGKVRQVVEALV